MEENKLPFKKERNKEKHKFKMENDPIYRAGYTQNRRDGRKRAKDRGYIPKPCKKASEMTQEEKDKKSAAHKLYREENKDSLKQKRSTPEYKAQREIWTLERRAKQRAEGKKTWTPKTGDAAKRANELAKKRRNANIEAAREKVRLAEAKKIAEDPTYLEKRRAANNAASQKYRENNKETRRKTMKKYNSTPRAKLYSYMRSRLSWCLSDSFKNKRTKGAMKLFGCDKDFLIKHIESQFTEQMCWDNWGPYWEVDHIIPFSLCNGNEENALKLNHYSNLRPLEVKENAKKSDNFIPELWPKDFPYAPEEFGLDRKDIPYFQALELRDKMFPTCYI